jgi:protein phosphatase
MKLYRLDEVGRTHIGRQRTHNEDCFFAETQLTRSDSPSGSALTARGLYILCDGMGGHSGGEVASALAVSTLRNYFATHWQSELPSEEKVTEAILKANQAIFDKNEAEGRSGNARMGTTLVMVLIDNTQLIVAHVGDSRLYALTRQSFYQLTEDHEVGQREVNRGVEPAIAYTRPDAYQLTQALGPRGNTEVKPTVNTMPITQDTLFLLCSDGLSDNNLLETHLTSHLEPMLRSRHDLDEGVANLIDLANEHNGHDNITAIAVRIKMRPNLEGT